MRKVLLTKIEERPDAEYPNNIPVNNVVAGIMHNSPVVGERFAVIHAKGLRGLITSEVQEIVSEDDTSITFKTVNSVYKVEYID